MRRARIRPDHQLCLFLFQCATCEVSSVRQRAEFVPSRLECQYCPVQPHWRHHGLKRDDGGLEFVLPAIGLLLTDRALRRPRLGMVRRSFHIPTPDYRCRRCTYITSTAVGGMVIEVHGPCEDHTCRCRRSEAPVSRLYKVSALDCVLALLDRHRVFRVSCTGADHVLFGWHDNRPSLDFVSLAEL